jgi:hypothetical protein
MIGISPALAIEVAETWETMAEMEVASSPDRRATLRECADMVRMLATRLAAPASPIPGGYEPSSANEPNPATDTGRER